MKEYILYVRKYSIMINDYKLYVYRVKTNDVLHTIGEMHYRTFEHIERIDFVECTQSRLDYIKSKNLDIYDWYDKYQNTIL